MEKIRIPCDTVFCRKIDAAVASQTIRLRGEYTLKPGDIIEFFDPKNSWHKMVRCASIEKIEISETGSITLNSGLYLGLRSKQRLAERTGFDCAHDMITYLYHQYAFPMEGDLIKWKPVVD